MEIVEVLIPGLPGPAMEIAGPALAGRAAGTGPLEPIPLGADLDIIDGALTWTGTGQSTSAYVHTQSTAAMTWTINHNLGYRPSVELLDSGSQEIDADISHPSVNQTVVTLNLPTAGLARLI